MSEFAALLKAARNLDQDALTAIFDLFSPALYKFVSRFVHDPTLADRLVASDEAGSKVAGRPWIAQDDLGGSSQRC